MNAPVRSGRVALACSGEIKNDDTISRCRACRIVVGAVLVQGSDLAAAGAIGRKDGGTAGRTFARIASDFAPWYSMTIGTLPLPSMVYGAMNAICLLRT